MNKKTKNLCIYFCYTNELSQILMENSSKDKLTFLLAPACPGKAGDVIIL